MSTSSNRGVVPAILVAALLAAPSLRAQASVARPPRSPEELAERYRNAHSRRDVEAIKRMFYWGASTDKTRILVTSFITQDVAHAIRGVTVKPLDPKDLTEYTQDGIRYRTTLPATAKLVIDFQPRSDHGGTYKSEQTSYLIGAANGEYWLLTAEPSPGGEQRPDFSGTWVLDTARSIRDGSLPALTLIVARSGDTLSVLSEGVNAGGASPRARGTASTQNR